jgi:hypothetical protein
MCNRSHRVVGRFCGSSKTPERASRDMQWRFYGEISDDRSGLEEPKDERPPRET